MADWQTTEPPEGVEIEFEADLPGEIQRGRLKRVSDTMSVGAARPGMRGLREDRPVRTGFRMVDSQGQFLTDIIRVVHWRHLED